MQNDYFGFVASAYAISGLSILGLFLWVILDARGRRAELKALEASGLRRRSSRGEPS